MSTSVAVVTKPNTALITPMSELPDYLKDVAGGGNIDALDSGDYTIPRLKLLQSGSPECKADPRNAIQGEYWHTGTGENLGKSTKIVILSVHKRVILWSARSGGNSEMLAFSSDGRNWDMGGNQTFDVEVDRQTGRKIKVNTNTDVQTSRLLEWGASDPNNPKSPPVATLIYEYLCMLPERPDLSPVVFGMYRTMTANAKKLNTQLLMIRNQRKPITSVAIECTVDTEEKDGDSWFIPDFKLAGYVSKEVYLIAKQMSESYDKQLAEYKPGNDAVVEEVKTKAKDTTKILDDEIPF